MLLSAPLPRCDPSWTRHHVSQLKPGAIPAVFLSAASQHLVPVPLKAHRPPSALVQAERGWPPPGIPISRRSLRPTK